MVQGAADLWLKVRLKSGVDCLMRDAVNRDQCTEVLVLLSSYPPTSLTLCLKSVSLLTLDRGGKG